MQNDLERKRQQREESLALRSRKKFLADFDFFCAA
jgi:hypothetical protein